jgi:hypothetical protein
MVRRRKWFAREQQRRACPPASAAQCGGLDAGRRRQEHVRTYLAGCFGRARGSRGPTRLAALKRRSGFCRGRGWCQHRAFHWRYHRRLDLRPRPAVHRPLSRRRLVRQSGWELIDTVGFANGTPRPLVVLSPMVARTLTRAGIGKPELKQLLFEYKHIPARKMETYIATWANLVPRRPHYATWLRPVAPPRSLRLATTRCAWCRSSSGRKTSWSWSVGTRCDRTPAYSVATACMAFPPAGE